MSYSLWSATDDPETPRGNHVPVRLHNGNILIASGGDPFTNILATAEIYNPDTGTWGAAGDLSVARTRF